MKQEMNKNMVADKIYDLFKSNEFDVMYNTMHPSPEPSEKDLDACVDNLKRMLYKLSKRKIADYIDQLFDDMVDDNATIDEAVLSMASAIVGELADYEATAKCFSERVRESAAFFVQKR